LRSWRPQVHDEVFSRPDLLKSVREHREPNGVEVAKGHDAFLVGRLREREDGGG
jgi:hypothetical protein